MQFALMVLAYEYRPAFKTPTFDPNNEYYSKFSQLVYSRTGIARIGNKPSNYDAENRCFTNLPKDKGDEKQIAVTPARYGLFLTELVTVNQDRNDSVKLMNYQDEERTNLGERHFIRPLRKIFDDGSLKIEFAEYHLNEKLFALSQFKVEGKALEFSSYADVNAYPFKRVSAKSDTGEKFKFHNSDNELVSLERMGCSVLLSSSPDDLIRRAKQNGKSLYFKVPPKWEQNFLPNRRYNAFKATDKKNKDVIDAVWTDFIYRRNVSLRATASSPNHRK